MQEEDIQDYVNKYAAYMDEIKRRVDVVECIFSRNQKGCSLTGYLETDIDLAHLQLRKIIELMMFACVIAHKAAGNSLNKMLRTGWEIGKIKKELAKYNTDFFPSPKKIEGLNKGIPEVSDIRENREQYMTEDEIESAYGRTGNYLHAQRDYQYMAGDDKRDELYKICNDVKKIALLLAHHWTRIDDKSFFAVILSDTENGNVGVSFLKEVA